MKSSQSTKREEQVSNKLSIDINFAGLALQHPWKIKEDKGWQGSMVAVAMAALAERDCEGTRWQRKMRNKTKYLYLFLPRCWDIGTGDRMERNGSRNKKVQHRKEEDEKEKKFLKNRCNWNFILSWQFWIDCISNPI